MVHSNPQVNQLGFVGQRLSLGTPNLPDKLPGGLENFLRGHRVDLKFNG